MTVKVRATLPRHVSWAATGRCSSVRLPEHRITNYLLPQAVLLRHVKTFRFLLFGPFVFVRVFFKVVTSFFSIGFT